MIRSLIRFAQLPYAPRLRAAKGTADNSSCHIHRLGSRDRRVYRSEAGIPSQQFMARKRKGFCIGKGELRYTGWYRTWRGLWSRSQE